MNVGYCPKRGLRTEGVAGVLWQTKYRIRICPFIELRESLKKA